MGRREGSGGFKWAVREGSLEVIFKWGGGGGVNHGDVWGWGRSFRGGMLLLLLLLSRFSRVRLCDPRDGSPIGSLVFGILQARTLEWVAISFSNAWKWKVKVKSLSRVRLLATPWTAAYQAPPSIGFSRQEYCTGVPLPSPQRGYMPGLFEEWGLE